MKRADTYALEYDMEVLWEGVDQPSAVSGRADVAVSGGEEGEESCGVI